MYTIRRLETVTSELYNEGIIRGYCHLYSGQEACAVGMRAVMRPADFAVTTYRCHGWAYMMGVPLFEILAEMAGRQSGCARGKGGSMHMYAKNFYGGFAVLGAQVPVGVGIGLANKYKENGGVSVALYGDGAANQGQVYEAYNMAKLWNIPCIFVCENNGFGLGTTAKRASANTNFYERAGYIPGIGIDGMDVVAVREAARFAIEYCASGNGPLVLETTTTRFAGHGVGDPGTGYRSIEEIQEVHRTCDPIKIFREKILNAELTTAEELKTLEAEVRADVAEAAKKAMADKEPGVEELTMDLYAKADYCDKIRNVVPFAELQHRTLGKAINM
jgi:pyruvate dehydrogenase E1 component alpha subunit